MTDVCAITSFTLDMVIGHDTQDFTARFAPVANVGGGSLLYIDGTEYGGIVDDITTDTESDIVECHGRTWDGILAAKRIMPPNNSAYRTVSGEANAVLASLVTLLDIGDVFAASTSASGITISSYKFTRFVDAYEGITEMLKSANAKLVITRVGGKTVLGAEAAQTIGNEVDSDLMDFAVTKTVCCVNHLVCAGEGEGTDRIVINLYADANGNVSTTQTFTGRDEIAAFYDYSNADATELLSEGTKKLQEYQTKGSVDVSRVGRGEWDVGDVIVARDNQSGVTVTTPIVGKTVQVSSSTNWELLVEYEVGEVSRAAASLAGVAESTIVSGVKGDAESVYRSGDVNITPADVGAVACLNQSAMDARVTSFSGTTQAFGLRATVINSNNALEGHEIDLIVSNDKLTVYDYTAGSTLFRYDTATTDTTTASSIATAAANVTFGTCTYKERNGMAMFSVAFTPNEAISSSTNIFTLVSGKRPAVACNGIDTSSTYSCYVQTNGNVQCRRALSKDTTYTFRATYMLA